MGLATIFWWIVVILLIVDSIRFVNQKNRALIERFGKFSRVVRPGLRFKFPLIERIKHVPIVEQMVDATRQEVITKDNLNATVDAQVYFKVKDQPKSLFNSRYAVEDYRRMIVQLARTTLRDLIGSKKFIEVNSQRGKLNQELHKSMSEEIKDWGLEIVRTEIKEIEPPKDVQEAMNAVLKAEQKKTAAMDLAEAAETEADGIKRAQIKEAEGKKQAKMLIAKGEAEAVKLVAEAAEKYFKPKAQLLKRLQVAENTLDKGTKLIVPKGSDLVNVIGDAVGAPVVLKRKK